MFKYHISNTSSLDLVGFKSRISQNEIRDCVFIARPNREPLLSLITLTKDDHVSTFKNAFVLTSKGILDLDAGRVPSRSEKGPVFNSTSAKGRFPTNFILLHDTLCDSPKTGLSHKGCVKGCPVKHLNEMSEIVDSGAIPPCDMDPSESDRVYQGGWTRVGGIGYGDRGGAARLFYKANSSKDIDHYLIKLTNNKENS